MKSSPRHSLLAVCALATTSTCSLWAQTYVANDWRGLGTTNHWTDAANWHSAIPGNTTSGATSSANWGFFRNDVGADEVVIIDNGRTIMGFSIYDNASVPSAPGSFTFGLADQPFATVYFTNKGGIQVKNPMTAPTVQTFNINIVLMPEGPSGNGESTFWTQAAGSRMVINGNVTSQASQGTIVMRLNGLSASPSAFNGIISDSTTGGAIAIDKLSTGDFILSGANTFSGGTTLTAGSIHVNHESALGTGVVTATGGFLRNTSGRDIALTSTNEFRLNNTLRYDSTHDLDWGNGTIILGASGATSTRAFQVDGTGNFIASGAITNGEGDSATSRINKTGTGTFVIAGTAQHTGTTTVSDGTLLIDGSHTGGGAYTVNSGATLGGKGTIQTANANLTLNTNAKLSPGSDTGHQLKVNLGTGTFNLTNIISGSAVGNLEFSIGSVAASDQLQITNAATTFNIGTGLLDLNDFHFTLTDGFGAGEYILISTLGGISGTLGTHLSGEIGGHQVLLAFDDGNRNLLLQVQPIPEPSTVGLLILSSAGLVWSRRLRKRRS